jgi:hypothetical protein
MVLENIPTPHSIAIEMMDVVIRCSGNATPRRVRLLIRRSIQHLSIKGNTLVAIKPSLLFTLQAARLIHITELAVCIKIAHSASQIVTVML